MARIQVVAEDVTLDSPTLIEGLPGAGLVGKIAADHLVSAFEMDFYGAVRCDGLPEVTIYRENSPNLQPPVRLYADADLDLVVLQSDVPVSPKAAGDFAGCITRWVVDHSATPLYLSGLPVDTKSGVPALFGVATGGSKALLDEHSIDPPGEDGVVSGPTGALLAHAEREDIDAVGLIVETQAQFPDPEAARVILEHGIRPIAEVDVDTSSLVEQAEDIQQAREQLAKRMQDADEESSEAKPLRMFQ